MNVVLREAKYRKRFLVQVNFVMLQSDDLESAVRLIKRKIDRRLGKTMRKHQIVLGSVNGMQYNGPICAMEDQAMADDLSDRLQRSIKESRRRKPRKG